MKVSRTTSHIIEHFVHLYFTSITPFHTNLYNKNFNPLNVVYDYRDTQIYVGEITNICIIWVQTFVIYHD